MTFDREELFQPVREVNAPDLESAISVLQRDYRYDKTEISLSEMSVTENFVLSIRGHDYRMTEWALGNFLRQLDPPVPEKFGQRIPPDLLQTIVDRLKQTKPRQLVVFIRDDSVVNIHRSPYQPARSVDVLNMVHKISTKRKLEIQPPIKISDRGIKLSFLDEQLPVVEPQVGDVTRIGYCIRNSQTGGVTLTGLLFLYRLRCKNGALLSEAWGSVRWPSDNRLFYNTSLWIFEQKFLELCCQQELLKQNFLEMYNRTVTDDELVGLWRAVARVTDNAIADSIIGIGKEDRENLVRVVRARWRRNHARRFDQQDAPVQTNLRAYNIYNRITQAARDMDYSLNTQLEKIAGGILGQ